MFAKTPATFWMQVLGSLSVPRAWLLPLVNLNFVDIFVVAMQQQQQQQQQQQDIGGYENENGPKILFKI
eukprot:Awhi_evm1s4119